MSKISIQDLQRALARLSDAQLNRLALEHFSTVYLDSFGPGVFRAQKENALLELCVRQPEQAAALAGALAGLGIRVLPARRPRAPKPAGTLPARGDGGPVEPPAPLGPVTRRLALLAGVRDFDSPAFRRLPHTVRDVCDLQAALLAAGYARVTTLHSDQPEARLRPTRARFLAELKLLADLCGPGDLILVYFGGHGLVSEGKPYLIVSDADKAALDDTAVPLERLRALLGACRAQVRLLFLDACHSGVGLDSQGMDDAFEEMAHQRAAGFAALSSCRRGEVSYEYDDQQHGAFTHFLLQGLTGAARDPAGGISFDGLKDYVTAQVRLWAGSQSLQQTPTSSAELVGDPLVVPA